MGHIDFDDSSLEDKARFVWDNAMFLDSLEYYNLRIDLYSLGKQFIEVYYETTTNKITRITFANNQDLKKHTSGVDINI